MATEVVYVTHGGRRWHTTPDCQALESGRMLWDSDEDSPYPIREMAVSPLPAYRRTPCRVCATPAAVEQAADR
jgi:hypothetical protein